MCLVLNANYFFTYNERKLLKRTPLELKPHFDNVELLFVICAETLQIIILAPN